MMKSRLQTIGLWLISASCLALSAVAQTPDSTISSATSPAAPSAASIVVTDDYEPVYFDPRKTPSLDNFYPEKEGHAGHGGWTVISTMISPAGTPYELSIVNSSGNAALDKAALKFTSKVKFKPAKVNGVPIDSGYVFKVAFHTSESRVSREFIAAYKIIGDLISSGDRAAAESGLKSLKIQNLYEDAYYGLAQFRYFSRWGNEEQQLQALNHAIAYEHQNKFLPKDLYEEALLATFSLKVKTQDFAGALKTHDDFSKAQKNDPAIKKVVASIKEMQASNTTYAIRSRIPTDSTQRFFDLLKRHFSVVVTSGKLAEIKLRCERNYALIPYTTDLDYMIPESFGACSMEVIGDSGAEFALIQS